MFLAYNDATSYVRGVMKNVDPKKLKKIKDAVEGSRALQIISKPDMLLQAIVDTDDASERTVAAYMYAHWQLLRLYKIVSRAEEDVRMVDKHTVFLFTVNNTSFYASVGAFTGNSVSVCEVSIFDDIQCWSGDAPNCNCVGYNCTCGVPAKCVFTGSRDDAVDYVREHCQFTISELWDEMYEQMVNPFRKVAIKSNEAIAETFSRQCAVMKRLCATAIPKVNFTCKACYK